MHRDESEAKRGGRRLPFNYGWVIVTVGALGVFTAGPGQTYVVSLFVDPIIAETGWSRTLVSGLYSAGSISALVGAVLAGWAFDRFGARATLTSVAALFGLGVYMMSRVSSPVHLFLGFFAIRSLGQTALTLVSTSMVGVWFVRLRGRATATTMLAAPLSHAILPPIVFLIIEASGWRSAWEVLGFAVWAIMIPPALFLVRRSPEAMGLLPDGGVQQVAQSSVAPAEGESWTVSEAIRTRSFWMLLFAGFPLAMIGTALVFHHISLMKSNGIEESTAAGILSVTAVVALLGTLIAGYLVDRFPNRIVLAVGLVMIALAMLWTLVISSVWEALIYGVLLGAAQGLVSTTSIVIWPNYSGRAHIGRIRGVAAIGMVVAAGLGPLPFGVLFEATGSYDVAILGFVGLPVICAVIALAAVQPTKMDEDCEKPLRR